MDPQSDRCIMSQNANPRPFLIVIVPAIILFHAFIGILKLRHWPCKQLCKCKRCAPIAHISIFSVMDLYKKMKIEREAQQIADKHSQTTVETQKDGSANKLFFNCWQILFQSTCLEECKDNAVRVELGSIYTSSLKKFSRFMFKTVIKVMHFVPYIFPLEFLAYQLKKNVSYNTSAQVFLSIIIVIFGFVRYLSQLFIVSLMSSRKELLRVGLESFDDLKWVYKLIKFHYNRSLNLAILFQSVKNIALICLLDDVSDFLTITNSFKDKQIFNLMIVAMFVLRYLIMLSLLDIGRTSTRSVVQNDDLVYKQQKKLWYILNFIPRYIPDENELASIVIQHSNDFELVEQKLQQKFDASYELFSSEMQVIKKLKCKSISTIHTGKEHPFTMGMLYFAIQCVGNIIMLILLLMSTGFMYCGETEDNFSLPASFFMLFEMAVFPIVFRLIIQIEVLFEDKAAEDLLKALTTKRSIQRRPKMSQDLTVQSNPLRQSSDF